MERMRYTARRYYDRNFAASDAVSIVPHVLNGDFPEHTHDYLELSIIRSGKAFDTVSKERTPISRGHLLVVPKGAAHSFSSCARLEHFNIALTGTFMQHIDTDIRTLPGFRLFSSAEAHVLRLSPSVMADIEQLLERLLAELSLRAEGHKAVTRILTTELIIRLARAYAGNAGGSTSIDPLSRIAGYIEANWNRELPLALLAKRFGSSIRHFDRVFKAHYRITPIEHILRLRLQRAEEMIASTNRQITDIAYDCGFSDSNYFSRQFKRLTGRRPIDVRSLRAPARR